MSFMVGVGGNVGTPGCSPSAPHVLRQAQVSIIYCRESPTCNPPGTAIVNQIAKVANLQVVHEAQVTTTAPDYTAEAWRPRTPGGGHHRGHGTYSLPRLAKRRTGRAGIPDIDMNWSGHDQRFPDIGGQDVEDHLPHRAGMPQWNVPKLNDFRGAMQKYVPGGVLASWSEMGWGRRQADRVIGKNFPGQAHQRRLLKGLYALNGETLGGLVPPLSYQEGRAPTNPTSASSRCGSTQQYVTKDGDNFTCARAGSRCTSRSEPGDVVRERWDRVLARSSSPWAVRLRAFFGMRDTGQLVEQLSYLISGGAGGLCRARVGVTLLINADRRDELAWSTGWRRLLRPTSPKPASTVTPRALRSSAGRDRADLTYCSSRGGHRMHCMKFDEVVDYVVIGVAPPGPSSPPAGEACRPGRAPRSRRDEPPLERPHPGRSASAYAKADWKYPAEPDPSEPGTPKHDGPARSWAERVDQLLRLVRETGPLRRGQNSAARLDYDSVLPCSADGDLGARRRPTTRW